MERKELEQLLSKRFSFSIQAVFCGRGQGVRISRLPYVYLQPPVTFCPASPVSFTGNILYYITQTKDKSRRVNQRRIFAREFVSFVYFDAICKSNNMIMLKSLFIIFFNVLSTWSHASGPLKTPASRSFLSRLPYPFSRAPPPPPTSPPTILHNWFRLNYK